MAYNKFMRGNDVLLDLTSDTVDAEHLGSGYTAHDKYGNQITGTAIIEGSGGQGFTHYETGTLTPTSNYAGNSSEDLTSAKIEIGFEPKIFYIYSNNAFSTNSSASPYPIGTSFNVFNLGDVPYIHLSDFVWYSSSTAKYGRSGGGENNGFNIGSNGTSVYLQQSNLKLLKNQPYVWYAWG